MKFNFSDVISPKWTDGDKTNTYWLNCKGELIGKIEYPFHVSIAWRQAYIDWHEGTFGDTETIVFSLAGASPHAVNISDLGVKYFPQDATDIESKKRYIQRLFEYNKM